VFKLNKTVHVFIPTPATPSIDFKIFLSKIHCRLCGVPLWKKIKILWKNAPGMNFYVTWLNLTHKGMGFSGFGNFKLSLCVNVSTKIYQIWHTSTLLHGEHETLNHHTRRNVGRTKLNAIFNVEFSSITLYKRKATRRDLR
jgi:hypothetical protein